ncbi:SCO7613 C-terminal domain-containing membrane protein [Planomonospora parontospora]|uniref:SCO7613 C-terminal domain-containing membrane protein n=1 Tax=Planomonospora parontospora TaxID=58119 RepID=UPI0016702AE6|nr:hypothetical protein [Planomonospora parontospora]GGL45554.1 hypothetical protein GCM10014719_53560 [Planomonospora parontospora subsp. antibiotica]GII18639.1 hypothetical protein Ppa05_53650 [Planomonospora parontospora subsp. antibiotica]
MEPADPLPDATGPLPDAAFLPGEPRCPECGVRLTAPQERCPHCALPLSGPLAAELWRLDQALAELGMRRSELLVRRSRLLRMLRAEGDRQGAQAGGSTPEAAPGARRAGTGRETRGPVGAGRTGGGRNGPGGGPARPGGDFSPKAVQNLLLALGGLLLAVAAVVFTAVSWGHLGIGGRAAVLAGFTAVILAVPRALAGRGLTATAETVAALGVVLLLLDGYAVRQAGLAGAGALAGNVYAGGVSAVVALAMAAYSRVVPLRLPLPAAVLFAQFPLVLLAAELPTPWVTAAFAATAAADAALLLFLKRRSAAPSRPGVRRTAAFSFGTVWTLGVLCGSSDSALGLVAGFSPADRLGAAAQGALLAVLALTGIAVALRRAVGPVTVLAAGSAFALAAGLAAPFLPLVHSGWHALVYTVAGLAVAAVALCASGPDAPGIRSAAAATGGVLAVLTVLPFHTNISWALTEPFARLDGIWSGPHGYGEGWSPVPLTPVFVLALLAASSAALAVRGRGPAAPTRDPAPAVPAPEAAGGGPAVPAQDPVPGVPAVPARDPAPAVPAAPGTAGSGHGLRRPAAVAALLFGTLGTVLVPDALDWTHPAAVATLLALTAVLAAGAALTGRRRRAEFLVTAAAAVTLLAAVTALAERTATHVALVCLLLVWAAAALLARTRAVRLLGAGLAAVFAGGEILAVEASLGWPARHAAFGLFAVAGLAAAVAGLARRPYGPAVRGSAAGPGDPGVREGANGSRASGTGREGESGPREPAGRDGKGRLRDLSAGLEAAGYCLAAWGLALVVHDALVPGLPHLPALSLACAVVGVLLSGTALRPDRRQAAYAGTGFLLVAAWLRLLASDVTVVEAYTVPLSLVLLAFGLLRTRGGRASSWSVYGSGLASGLLPSTIAVLTGDGGLRPLLLGVFALAILLAGARSGLQAPAVLGGLTLAVVALHELAPWIAQAVAAVPRWVPMALGGLLLVVVGATYEARLREVRRLREAVGRMR